jgi:hypothetical protein
MWSLALGIAIVLWAFLLASDVAHFMGAWADLALIVWTTLVVEGFTAAMLDGFVSRGDPRVAAATWTGCSICSGRVPFDVGEHQARCPFCDSVVLPPGSPAAPRRREGALRAVGILSAMAALMGGLVTASRAPLIPSSRVALILAAMCFGAVAWPFRRYLRNQSG